MKKLLTKISPILIALFSIVTITLFLRFYLFINSSQLIKEFQNQNYKELYSMDTLQVSSRLNSLSTVINWVCIKGSLNNQVFFSLKKGNCQTSLFQQHQEFSIPEANNIVISFTVRLPKEVEIFFLIYLIFQTILIVILFVFTKKVEADKYLNEAKINRIARQVSHDIRSPLGTLNAIVDSIENLSEDKRKLLNYAVERINNISNNLLKNSQGNNFVPIPTIKSYELNEILNSLLKEKQTEYSVYLNTKISFHPLDKEIYVNLDSFEFVRCISNIINNSIEARNINTFLEVQLKIERLSGNEVKVTITDNGKGIPKEIINQIGLGEITSKKDGNGLGLIHTFESVKNWNGRVSIKSEIDFGTEVSIILPVEIQKTQCTILLDDDELVRLTWEHLAKKHNQTLFTFSNSDELFKNLDSFGKNSTFYLDSNLGKGIKGENIGLVLYQKGFINLYLTTGYKAEDFKDLAYIKGVKDKSPPWK